MEHYSTINENKILQEKYKNTINELNNTKKIIETLQKNNYKKNIFIIIFFILYNYLIFFQLNIIKNIILSVFCLFYCGPLYIFNKAIIISTIHCVYINCLKKNI